MREFDEMVSMDELHCPVCGDEYGLVEDAYKDGTKYYEPVWCCTCHAWHENVYEGGEFLGTETNLD